MTRSLPSIDMSLSDSELTQFRDLGYVGPYPLLGPAEIESVVGEYHERYRDLPWYKAQHVYQGVIVETALRDAVVGRARSILGDDLVLWCSQIMFKRPGEHHRWHVDVETLAYKSINVWVALQNVNERATIQVVPRSHHFDVAPQDLEKSEGLDTQDGEAVHRRAQQLDAGASVLTVAMEPGEFVIFDGHTWHASVNNTQEERTALLLQYSPAGEVIKRPLTFGEPVTWADAPPPVLQVAGHSSGTHNNVVEPKPYVVRQTPKRWAQRVKDRLRP